MERRFHKCNEAGEAYHSRVFIGTNKALCLEHTEACDECRKLTTIVIQINECPWCGKSRDLILGEVTSREALPV